MEINFRHEIKWSESHYSYCPRLENWANTDGGQYE